MKIESFDDFYRGKNVANGPLSVSIGVFDGIHKGHKKIIESITKNEDTFSLIVTFKQSPVEVLKKGVFPGYISTLKQKIGRIEKLGVDNIILIDFSIDFSRLTGEEFLDILKKRLDIRCFVVGYNFNFGYNRDTDANKLKDWSHRQNIETVIVQPVYYGNEIISSSRIRREIYNGNIEIVNEMLAFDYSLMLVNGFPYDEPLSMHRNEGGKDIFFEKSNIKQILPEEGCFEVELKTDSRVFDGYARITDSTLEVEPIIDKNEILKEIIFKKKINQ